MVGNDIVDLKQATLESNWQRKGFLNKVFTLKEINSIKESEHPSAMVWQLWSMKESAYKINVQQYKYRFFNPKKIECTLLDPIHGVVKIGSDIYLTHSTKNNAFIYTVAVLNTVDDIQSEHFEIDDADYKNQHQICHLKLRQALAERLHVKKESITIKKDSFGTPNLYNNKKHIEISCSLTHHGNYGAYAISC